MYSSAPSNIKNIRKPIEKSFFGKLSVKRPNPLNRWHLVYLYTKDRVRIDRFNGNTMVNGIDDDKPKYHAHNGILYVYCWYMCIVTCCESKEKTRVTMKSSWEYIGLIEHNEEIKDKTFLFERVSDE